MTDSLAAACSTLLGVLISKQLNTIGVGMNTMERSRRRPRRRCAGKGATVGVLGILLTLVACGGNPSGPTPPPGQSTPAITVYEPGNGVSLPTLVRDVKPSYTPQAFAARIHGSVLLSAVVLADGTVGDVAVLRSLDTLYGLDAQAVSASKQWLFNPGQKDGVAVAVRVTIEMTFTLA